MNVIKFSSLCLALAMGLAFTPSASAEVINGGFEANDGTSPTSWFGFAETSGISISSDAAEGSSALSLSSPSTNASGVEQNTLNVGGAALNAGDDLSFSFQAKGFAGTTGNAQYRVALLDGVGNILTDTGIQFFQGDINDTTYSLISTDLTVPTDATTALVQFTHAIGPIDAGNNLFGGEILIDDVQLVVTNAIPEPSSVVLLAVAGIGFVVRRRK